MNNWTIRLKLAAAFVAIILAMAAVAGINMVYLDHVTTHVEEVGSQHLKGLFITRDITKTWRIGYTLTQRYTMLHDPDERADILKEISADRVAHEKALVDYSATIVTTEGQQKFKAMLSARAPFFQTQSNVLELAKAGKDAEAQALITSKLYKEFETVVALIQDTAEQKEKVSQAKIDSTMQAISRIRLISFIGSLLTILLAIITGVYLFRQIIQPLNSLGHAVRSIGNGDLSQALFLGSNDEFGQLAGSFNQMRDALATLITQVQISSADINSSVSQIAVTSREQQATTTEIASTTTEIGVTSREISATSKELLRTMDAASQIAEKSAIMAGASQNGLLQMEETMHRVMSATGSISAKLAVLSEKASNITQVITTITKVADQTNLLSLNAAIEAEKAGEYGRGFAVVAVEIRRLADQTAVATSDIENMVRDIQAAVSTGVMGMDKFSDEVRRGTNEVKQVSTQLGSIISQVQDLAPRFETINEGMQSQSSGAEQISQSLVQLNVSAQQTAQSFQQSTQAIDNLGKVSAGLCEGISRFKLKP